MDEGMKPTQFILVFVVMIIILTIWQLFFFKNVPQTTTTQIQDSLRQTQTIPVETQLKVSDTLFQVETDMYLATFSKNGGITSFKVKRVGNIENIEIVDSGSIIWGETDLAYNFDNPTKQKFILNGDSLQIKLIAENSEITKTLTFYSDKYLIRVSFEGKVLPFTTFKGKLKFTSGNERLESQTYSYWLRAKNNVKFNPDKIKEQKEYDLKDLKWFGVRSRYFFAGVLNLNKPGKVFFNREKIHFFSEQKEFFIYLGPSDYLIFKKNHPDLGNAFDFGGFIIRPFSMAIYFIINGIRKIIPNYGWVIVIFALFMKVAFFPITRKTIIASKRMQELKPKLDTLQKIYKDNPQKLQQEMMELYKKYNINPFSGCLTLLVQMPIFFALYQILINSILLKGSPFIFWIKDLSEKDPYYVLPILMGLTQILNANLQQTATDTQSKIFMYLMPIIFLFFFISLPSGIVLYWLTFNIFGIFEALLIKRLEGHHDT